MNNTIAAGAVMPLKPVTSIYIATEGGMRLVEATIVGAFGLHLSRRPPSPESIANRWILTHIGSGRALAKAGSEDDARSLAERLNALPADWDFRTPDQMSQWPETQIAEVSALVERYGQPFRHQPGFGV